MFYIVEFHETQEVEVVPAAWVTDDVCQWPSHYKPDEMAKAIKNEEQPEYSWEEYRVTDFIYSRYTHHIFTRSQAFKNIYTLFIMISESLYLQQTTKLLV